MGVLHSKQIDYWKDPLDFGSIVPHDHSTMSTPSRDYDTKLVKRFIREGRLAPFYTGCYEKPDTRNNYQSDMLTTTSYSLLHTNSSPKQDNNVNLLTLATQRMNIFLASHIPEKSKTMSFIKIPRSVRSAFWCCNKPICTECFLQLKRSVDTPSLAINCPFCMHSHLGVIRVPPHWSLHYANFCKRRHKFLQNQEMGKRKRLCIFDPDVVLVDHVQPDWQENLGTSSGNASSNGSTRRAVVRPIQSPNTSATPDISLGASSSTNSCTNLQEESLVMEYLRSNTSSAFRKMKTDSIQVIPQHL